MPNKINYIIFGLSALLFLVLNFGLGIEMQVRLNEILYKLTGYFFGISTNTFDYLALAAIPIFGTLYNSTRKRFKKTKLIIDITTTLFFVIIVFAVGLYCLVFIGKPKNPLLPQFLLVEPFELYSTMLIVVGSLIPFLIVKFIKK